ncbi:MAG: PIN domain-containing protein [Deltaproteobacteria bacterium]|nr:PIN domain-containing protein [Deltaproteobacteria bacterium]
MIGITFDTGALVALERRRQRVREILEHALATDQRITVPADVVGEWWRGRTDVRESILASVDVEPLTERLAKLAGEALAAVPGATLVDAIVMASAASRGDVVYTSDTNDLDRLRRHFPGVRVLAVQATSGPRRGVTRSSA